LIEHVGLVNSPGIERAEGSGVGVMAADPGERFIERVSSRRHSGILAPPVVTRNPGAVSGFGRVRAALVILSVASRTGFRRDGSTPIQPKPKRHCPVANIKSQIKRNKQNDAAHERNKSVKSALKTSIRKFREAAESGEAEQAQALAKAATRRLDKAASAGVIHKNQAANKKSAIAKQASSL
jgi:small subunit ribosomal protein S20